MSAPLDEKTAHADHPEVLADAPSHAEHAYDLDDTAKASAYKADAVEAENAEHAMGVIDAIKAYPMASFWAFIMSFTIVSTPRAHSKM